MLNREKVKAKLYERKHEQESDILEPLRYAAACKLCTWHEHAAGGGSQYITIGKSLVLRFADHENVSREHSYPDHNFVNEVPTAEDIAMIVQQIVYPELCRKTSFALHVGLTVPRLKRLLTPECFRDVCENDRYPNTSTQQIVCAIAFQVLVDAGVTARIPVSQELQTFEDYCGY